MLSAALLRRRFPLAAARDYRCRRGKQLRQVDVGDLACARQSIFRRSGHRFAAENAITQREIEHFQAKWIPVRR
jgi:hypothetical protein